MTKNVLSIDLEDWYHSSHLKDYAKEKTPQVNDSVTPLLKLFKKYHATTTLFTLGEVAEKNQEIIELIKKEGHEIGSHGYSHKPLWDISKEEFAEETIKTTRILTKISKEKIIGYRAPYFSVDKRSGWAFDILKKNGYKYDTSIFPIKMPKPFCYGCSESPLAPYNPSKSNIFQHDPEESFKEFPLTVFNIGKLRIPLAGGIYIRSLIPFIIFKALLRRVEKQGRPIILFFHPWETHKGIMRLEVPLKNRFVAYKGINSMLRKIEYLLKHYGSTSFRNIL